MTIQNIIMSNCEQRTCSWRLGSLHSECLSQDSNLHSRRYRPSTAYNQLTHTTRGNGSRINSEQQSTSIINDVQKEKKHFFGTAFFATVYTYRAYTCHSLFIRHLLSAALTPPAEGSYTV